MDAAVKEGMNEGMDRGIGVSWKGMCGWSFALLKDVGV